MFLYVICIIIIGFIDSVESNQFSYSIILIISATLIISGFTLILAILGVIITARRPVNDRQPQGMVAIYAIQCMIRLNNFIQYELCICKE